MVIICYPSANNVIVIVYDGLNCTIPLLPVCYFFLIRLVAIMFFWWIKIYRYMYFHFALNMPRRRISGDGCAKQDADSKAKSNRSGSSSSSDCSICRRPAGVIQWRRSLNLIRRRRPRITDKLRSSFNPSHERSFSTTRRRRRLRLSHGSFRTRAESRTKTAPEMNGFHSSNTKIFTLTEFSRKQGEINTKKSTKKTN